jgi:hypothetical protein
MEYLLRRQPHPQRRLLPDGIGGEAERGAGRGRPDLIWSDFADCPGDRGMRLISRHGDASQGFSKHLAHDRGRSPC